MAGDVVFTKTFTSDLADQLMNLGLGVEVKVDLSHNHSTTTTQPGAQNPTIIAKPIELDVAIKANGNDKDKLVKILASMQAASPFSSLFAFYQMLQTVPGGLLKTLTGDIKVECPQFDASIIDLANPPPGDIGLAIQAAQATGVAAFNSLPTGTRRCMGMYLKVGSNFTLIGQKPAVARTAP
ncbi:hypothetical protein [Indioceanicola profundi]|uniref:hypothetical protein n=1 Tax=Indioceanicola profundi TaxID=2220096 RepID=UPI0013C4442B|nr:hypothetical protein [Indioceanicola profundi]